jgi:hypothetical protein
MPSCTMDTKKSADTSADWVEGALQVLHPSFGSWRLLPFCGAEPFMLRAIPPVEIEGRMGTEDDSSATNRADANRDRAPTLGQIVLSASYPQLVAESQDRLGKGRALRDKMLADLGAGRTPTGYRAAFLHATAALIIKVLMNAAERFNAEHLDDMCSVADLLDVLSTARQKLLDGLATAERGSEVSP